MTSGRTFIRWGSSCDENLSDRIVVAAGQLQANRLSSDLIYPRDDAAPPSPLRAIVETCLQPLPDDRYQTADELAEDLDCWLRDRPLKTVRDSDSVASILRRIPRDKGALSTGPVCVLMALILIRGQGSAVTNNRTANDSTGVSTSKRLAAARDAVALSEEGRLHVEMKDFAAAIPVLERAVNLNPELAPAWHNLGVAQFRLSEFGRAEASFDRVIELGNRSGLVYSHRGAARFALGDVAGADADFAEAMRIARPTERAEVALNMRTFQERRQSQMEEQAGDVRAGKAAPR